MCFAPDARPPELPAGLVRARIAGGAGAEMLELTSGDGTRFSAAVAESPAAEPGAPAVAILPDVRGLYPFYTELAERFAEAGHHAVVVDYFGRTAGLGPRDGDFEYMPHVQATTLEGVQGDLAAAIAALRERVGDVPVVAVGFCFGGTMAYLAATNHGLGLAGVVAFYGGLNGARFGFPNPPDVVGDMRGPILGLFGGADQGIPGEAVDAFGAGLTAAGVEHEIVVYPGAPHSFFDRRQDEFADASADAWRRTLGFLGGRRQAGATAV